MLHLEWNLIWNLEFGIGMVSEEISHTNMNSRDNSILNKCVMLYDYMILLYIL